MATVASNVSRNFRSCVTQQSLTSYIFPKRHLHISYNLQKSRRAGEYKVTINRTKPLTYEQAMKPTDIAFRKGFNAANTAQLEGTFLEREKIGQDIPHKTFTEDLFIRKFMAGTWPETISDKTNIIIKRQHNLVRIAFIIGQRKHSPDRIYFLIGYTEELLSYWLKCPVKLEIQSIDSYDKLTYKYI